MWTFEGGGGGGGGGRLFGTGEYELEDLAAKLYYK